MTLYELYRYTPKEIIEVEYLLDQVKRFNILDEETFTPFVLKTDMRELADCEIYEKFKLYLKESEECI